MNKKIKSLFMLDSKITYLNHGSFGACPKPIFNELINWQKKLEREPVKHLVFDIYNYLEKSRDALSKYVDCNKNDVIFSPNPSTALNTVIKSLKLKKDDEENFKAEDQYRKFAEAVLDVDVEKATAMSKEKVIVL